MATTNRLPGPELQRLSRISIARGLFDVVSTWGVILGSMWVAAFVDAWFAYVAAVIVIASRQAALANLAHDAWHRLCLPTRRTNDFIGAWFYSYPVGMPHFHDRRRHLKHHRLVGQHDDPDWVNYALAGRETAPQVIRVLGGRLAGSLLWSTMWSVAVTRKPRIALADEPARDDEPRHEMLRVAVCQFVLLGVLTFWFGWWSYPLFWLLPLATLTAFCNSLRALVEHFCVDPEAPPHARMQDIDAGLLERLFFSPAHFHFHALHHAHPTVPHYRLSRAKQVLLVACGSYPYPVLPGYLRALRAHLASLPRKDEGAS